MRRRDFLAVLGTTAALLSCPALATERLVGILVGLPKDNPTVIQRIGALREQLAKTGWIEGQTIKFDYVLEPDLERLRERANELVARGCELIVAWSTPEVLAALASTKTTPIVFLAVADPLGSHLVQSLSRPEGNVTGIMNFEPSLGSKWVELLHDRVPAIMRVAVVSQITNPAGKRLLEAIEEAAVRRGLPLSTIEVGNRDDLQAALRSFSSSPDGGLVVMPGIGTNNASSLLIDAAARLHIPAVYPFRSYVDAGGLASYGVDPVDAARHAASYVDRILRGATPQDLPVEGPAKFELVVNLKVAKQLGIAVPQNVLVAADEVIE